MKTIRYLSYGRYLLTKAKAQPIYLVFFVTDRCTAKCSHCLRGGGEDDPVELSLDEIGKISASMGKLLFLLPTGGEPFLRDDLPEIVEIFHRNNRVLNVGIPSNGSLTEKVIQSAKKILEHCPGLDVAVDISIDGLGEDHDRVRGVEGLFDKAVWTLKELIKLKQSYRNFNVNAAVCVSAHNQYNLEKIYHYLQHELHVPGITTLLVRGEPRDRDALSIDIAQYRKFCDLQHAAVDGYRRFPFCDFINAMKILRARYIAEISENKTQPLPCYAGVLSCVIRHNGDVYPCELLDRKLGSLRDAGFDFQKIWRSPEREKIRKEIEETNCSCTYECFLTNSILFTPSVFPEIFKEYVRIKKGRPGKAFSQGSR